MNCCLSMGPWPLLAALAVLLPLQHAVAANGQVYRCPGPPVLYTDALSADEARERGCRSIEGAPVTIIQGPARRAAVPPAAPGASGSPPAAARPPEAKVDPGAQRARDSDARRILEGELRREEEKLAQLRRDYNNGEPERRGEERYYQMYIDRVAQLKASITRTESDIAALRRELAKLPS